MHDLEIARLTVPDSDLYDIDLYGDTAYIDEEFQLDLFDNKSINLIAPNKKQKGQPRNSLFQRVENSIHSEIRQPIDTLFGWIDDQAGIQNASKVRSITGLFLHIHRKILTALPLVSNSNWSFLLLY